MAGGKVSVTARSVQGENAHGSAALAAKQHLLHRQCCIAAIVLIRMPANRAIAARFYAVPNSDRVHAEVLCERLDDRHLALIQLVPGLSEGEPACPIRLGKAPEVSRSRLPFDLEAIAAEARQIEIAGECKGDDRFAARLANA